MSQLTIIRTSGEPEFDVFVKKIKEKQFTTNFLLNHGDIVILSSADGSEWKFKATENGLFVASLKDWDSINEKMEKSTL